MTKEQNVHMPVKLIEPNKWGGHDIYPKSHGFSIQEKINLWDWYKEYCNAGSISWDSEKGCLTTMGVVQ